MRFVKQVYEYLGATVKRAVAGEPIGVSLAEVSLPAGAWAPAGSAQPSPSRGQHTRVVRPAVLAGRRCLPCLAFPGWKRVSQAPVSPRLCTALREAFSEELCSAAERR